MRLLAPILFVTFMGTIGAQTQISLLHTFDGPGPWVRIGHAVAGAGDVNDDGFDDVIVGAPYESVVYPEAGRARVYSGLDGSILHVFSGAYWYYQMGFSIDGAGDVDGDGFDDVIVGAPGGEYNNQTTGLAYVFSGADGSVIHTLHGDPGDGLGVSVAGAGDVDGDGIPDLIAGAPSDSDNGNSCGSAKVFSGATGALLYTFLGDSSNDQMGRSVAGAGDVNGDGHADLVAGAFYDDDNATSCGSARVYSGLDGAIIRTHYGESAYDLMGFSVDGAGDVNGDGRADVIIGVHRDDDNGSDSGSARIYSGLDGSLIHLLVGNSAGDQLGHSVAGVGDMNGDGVPDVVAGAPFDDIGPDGGSATVFSGADGTVLHSLIADAFDDRLGFSVAGAGDADADGFADLVVGAPYDDDNGASAGRVTVWVAPTYPYLKYRTDHPVGHRLDCDWIPDAGDPFALTATIVCSDATPGGLGLYGLSLARIDYLVFGYLPLLIADDPVNLIDSGSFGFDILGQLTIPGASRQSPAIAGSLVYLQFFETSPIISCSPGIRLLIAP